MFKMRQLLLQKKQKELSEYKAIGMIQDHLFLLSSHTKHPRDNKAFNPAVPPSRENGRKSHRYEEKQSLISWVFIMSIV